MEIVSAATPERLAMERQLFEEYWQSFGFTPCFQNFAAEVALPPGYFLPPAGPPAIAVAGGATRGAVAPGGPPGIGVVRGRARGLRRAPPSGPLARGSQAALCAPAVPRSRRRLGVAPVGNRRSAHGRLSRNAGRYHACNAPRPGDVRAIGVRADRPLYARRNPRRDLPAAPFVIRM